MDDTKSGTKGFTLIESLLVLAIFMILSSVTAFTIKNQFEVTQGNIFLTQLQADFFYAQQFAISHQQEVTVHILPENHYYVMNYQFNMPVVAEKYYSKNILVTAGSLPLYFKFLPDGNVNKFGFFSIKCGNRLYKMTVLLGMGRFYITEE